MEGDLVKSIDMVEELSPQEKEEIKQWVRDAKSIEVLVTGKTGAGKSSLLNFLLGKSIFKVSKDKAKPCTSEVYCEDSEKNGIKIRAWDSPGLQDGTGDARYLVSMKEKCQNIDLLLYCISMEELRSDLETHTSAINKIDSIFDKRCWKNTIFVLTFANARVELLEAKGVPEDQLKIGLKDRIKQWREEIQNVLKKLGVDKKIIDKIHVVPAGHPTEPHLPGYKHWLSVLWSSSLVSMKRSGQTAFIKMETQGSQGGFVSSNDATDEQISTVNPDERQIVYTRGVKLAIVATAAGIITTGTVIGAAVGGTIGALAIGIPSFGVAAGAGLGIGATVGGAIGSGIAVGVGALIALYRRHKLNETD